MIVRPTEDEAKLLDRCLSYLNGKVDEMCITITLGSGDKKGKKACEKIIDKYGGKVSYFDWIHDFSAARNYNFAQATNRYIFWCDSDDLVRGAEQLKPLVEKMEKDHVDAVVMNYLYDFDDQKRCTVTHLKTRIVRKDAVKWVGKVHEDFDAVRAIESLKNEEVEILHLTDADRAGNAAKRNLEIAKKNYEKTPKDPRSVYLMANAQMGVRNIESAMRWFKDFVVLSSSDEERYLAYINMGEITKKEEYFLKALSVRPIYPNAYFKLAELKYNIKEFETAIHFLELGLQLPVPQDSIIVHNPRDYDYNPLMIMMNCYFRLGKYEKSIKILDELLKSYPDDENLKQKKALVQEEEGDIQEVDKVLKAAKGKKGEELKKFLEKQSERINSHPKMCVFRNQNFIKKSSSGKDLVYYCGYTSKVWNPAIAEKKGVGGSEEAVINLSKQWAEMGWNVTVYNNCGEAKNYDGVHYKPFWAFNVKNKEDVIIVWRHPKPVEYNLNADKIFLDLHDVLPPGEFTKERLKKIDKIFVKTQAHRRLFPKVPDNKFAIIPNGVDPSQFEQKIEKDPYLIINTSSPDRHLDATLDIFEELIKREPDNPWRLAWYYGWEVYDAVHTNNKEMKEWKTKVMKRFNKLINSGRAEGGMMIPQNKVAEKYMKASYFLYPTEFMEIHCISAVKAQLADCKMVSSDFGALKETVNFGEKIHTKGEKWMTENTFGDPQTEKYLEGIKKVKVNPAQKQWAIDTYNWNLISKKWNDEISS